jgi:hypothetical protein
MGWAGHQLVWPRLAIGWSGHTLGLPWIQLGMGWGGPSSAGNGPCWARAGDGLG